MVKVEQIPVWISPETVIIDHRLLSFQLRHIGFFDGNMIINYNRLENRCDFDLRLRKIYEEINGVPEKKGKRKESFKYSAKKERGLPFILSMKKEDKITFKTEMEIISERNKRVIGIFILEIEYYPSKYSYRMIKAEVVEIS